MAKAHLMIVTASGKKEAEKIAKALLIKKLIACANILDGAESHFWWKGKLEKAGEAVIFIKTTQKRVKAVEALIKKLHSYENPEIIGFEIESGSKAYLDWVSDSVR